ncbi:hypothetical protein MBLNU457_g0120t1 [Dothideomycetes sp. NU457]
MAPVTRKRKLDEEKSSPNAAQAETPPKKIKQQKSGKATQTDNTDDNDEGTETFEIPNGDKSIICKKYYFCESKSATMPSLIFTHGAGGGIETPATVEFARGFVSIDTIVCFQGTMNLKSRVKSFHTVIEDQDWGYSLGGRSMGARAAVMTANEYGKTHSLVLVSYPLVSEKGDVRDEILLEIPADVAVLFVIGDGDKMCPLDQLSDVRKRMKATSWLVVVKGANHGMDVKPKRATEPVRRETGEVAAQWLKRRDLEKLEAVIEWSQEDEKVSTTAWHEDINVTRLEQKVDSLEQTEQDGEEDTKARPKSKRKEKA